MAEQTSNNPAQPAKEEDTITGERYPDIYHEYRPDKAILQYQEKDDIFVYESANGLALKVEVVTEAILRFRYAPEGRFERGFSYAIDPAIKQALPKVTIGGDGTHFFIHTRKVRCRIDKQNLQVSLYEAQGQKLICEDAAPYYCRRTILKGTDQVKVAKKAPAGEAYFGMGDKTCSANLRGHRVQNWNTDSFSYKKGQDPLYRSIPFYYATHDGVGYGIFFDNSFRTHFDFDSEQNGATSFWADGGEMDYYFLYGPALLDVARRYAWLTGRPELPPLWALGFHQCRWSYYPESRVMELAQEFREREIPCDAIYLDIDYMDGYRCFTWNKAHFPNPAGMIEKLRNQGFQTVVMIDPGIKVDPEYKVYQEGMKHNAFVYRSTGELMRGPVWPPDCVFPDYTRPDVREWWGGLYQGLYLEDGVSGFWNDMNEPAVFKVDNATCPDNVLHHYEGAPCDHRKAHNVYGQQMSRATFEGLKRLKPGKRPFVLTRATFSGGQRYASVWTGDNAATWEHLRMANLQCQRLSISGFSFVGTDIGGFNKQPDGELFIRWLQLAVFHPLFRVHSMGNNIDGAAEAEAELVQTAERDNRIDQEPWSFGEENTALARQAIELRYQLLPYLYTAFYKNAKTGEPVIRSLCLYSQEDPVALEREEEFLFGDNLLVAPVLEPGVQSIQAYLPQGRWYDYRSGILYEGRQMATFQAEPGQIPLLAKAGAVIANYPVQQYVGEKKFDAISLRAYYGEGRSELYEDAGEGYGYRDGQYKFRIFTTSTGQDVFAIGQSQEGAFQTDYRTFQILIFGLPFQVSSCRVDGQEVGFEQEGGQVRVEVKEGFGEVVVKP
ncbi:MAG: glycoside hydrolase family 31 protein [Lewinellaceae bacterium]|nr:glycoside hydrolase family 31 protein [Phaeodactylibacter sp.]MCB9041098.1 glycoside hydrolase family 31 protein [Lewinellaceae bacterium]